MEHSAKVGEKRKATTQLTPQSMQSSTPDFTFQALSPTAIHTRITVSQYIADRPISTETIDCRNINRMEMFVRNILTSGYPGIPDVFKASITEPSVSMLPVTYTSEGKFMVDAIIKVKKGVLTTCIPQQKLQYPDREQVIANIEGVRRDLETNNKLNGMLQSKWSMVNPFCAHEFEHLEHLINVYKTSIMERRPANDTMDLMLSVIKKLLQINCNVLHFRRLSVGWQLITPLDHIVNADGVPYDKPCKPSNTDDADVANDTDVDEKSKEK